MCEECGCELPTLICPVCGGKMVLINDQAVCLVCGTSPSSGGDPSEQGDSHAHPHAHEHDEHSHPREHTERVPGKARAPVPDDIAKLRVLIPHWIDHNEEHAASFQRWATKARELGRQAVAERIEVAVAQMETCNEALTAALESLEG